MWHEFPARRPRARRHGVDTDGLQHTAGPANSANPLGPRRLVRPRTPAFHAGNVGSNPAGDAPQRTVKDALYGDRTSSLSPPGVDRPSEQDVGAAAQRPL